MRKIYEKYFYKAFTSYIYAIERSDDNELGEFTIQLEEFGIQLPKQFSKLEQFSIQLEKQ